VYRFGAYGRIDGVRKVICGGIGQLFGRRKYSDITEYFAKQHFEGTGRVGSVLSWVPTSGVVVLLLAEEIIYG